MLPDRRTLLKKYVNKLYVVGSFMRSFVRVVVVYSVVDVLNMARFLLAAIPILVLLPTREEPRQPLCVIN